MLVFPLQIPVHPQPLLVKAIKTKCSEHTFDAVRR